MSRPVERWLETFMCKQYADTFEAYGYKTLQSVCQLDPNQLRVMGVAPEHCEKIMENVSVLRQSYIHGAKTPPAVPTGPGYPPPVDPIVNPASTALANMSRSLNKGNMPSYEENMAAYSSMAGNPGMHAMNFPPHDPRMGGMSPAMQSGYGVGGMPRNYGPPRGPMYPQHHHHQLQLHQQQQQHLQQQQQFAGLGNPYMSHLAASHQQMSPQSYGGGPANYSGPARPQQYGSPSGLGPGPGPGQGPSPGPSPGPPGPPGPQLPPGPQGPSPGPGPWNMNSPGGTPTPPSGPGYGSAAGNPIMPPPVMHHYARKAQQSPQQVADDILHMASSAYGSNGPPRGPPSGVNPNTTNSFRPPMTHNQSESACMSPNALPPNQIPPNQMAPGQMSPAQHMMPNNQACYGMPESQGGHYSYPNMSPMSRNSPLSPMQVPSPGSMHSNMPTVSPGPMRSPAALPERSASSVTSPGMARMTSPTGMQTMQSSPHSVFNSPMTSPAYQGPPAQANAGFSPGHTQANLHGMTPPPGHSTSSAYNPMCSPAPGRTYTDLSGLPSSTSVTTSSSSACSNNARCTPGPPSTGNSNPLQSLQKLVMLPESQVVDPKSVVNEACMQGCEGTKNGEGTDGWDLPSNPIGSLNEWKCADGVNCGSDQEGEAGSPACYAVLKTVKEAKLEGGGTGVISGHNYVAQTCNFAENFNPIPPMSENPPDQCIPASKAARKRKKKNTPAGVEDAEQTSPKKKKRTYKTKKDKDKPTYMPLQVVGRGKKTLGSENSGQESSIRSEMSDKAAQSFVPAKHNTDTIPAQNELKTYLSPTEENHNNVSNPDKVDVTVGQNCLKNNTLQTVNNVSASNSGDSADRVNNAKTKSDSCEQPLVVDGKMETSKKAKATSCSNSKKKCTSGNNCGTDDEEETKEGPSHSLKVRESGGSDDKNSTSNVKLQKQMGKDACAESSECSADTERQNDKASDDQQNRLPFGSSSKKFEHSSDAGCSNDAVSFETKASAPQESQSETDSVVPPNLDVKATQMSTNSSKECVQSSSSKLNDPSSIISSSASSEKPDDPHKVKILPTNEHSKVTNSKITMEKQTKSHSAVKLTTTSPSNRNAKTTKSKRKTVKKALPNTNADSTNAESKTAPIASSEEEEGKGAEERKVSAESCRVLANPAKPAIASNDLTSPTKSLPSTESRNAETISENVIGKSEEDKDAKSLLETTEPNIPVKKRVSVTPETAPQTSSRCVEDSPNNCLEVKDEEATVPVSSVTGSVSETLSQTNKAKRSSQTPAQTDCVDSNTEENLAPKRSSSPAAPPRRSQRRRTPKFVSQYMDLSSDEETAIAIELSKRKRPRKASPKNPPCQDSPACESDQQKITVELLDKDVPNKDGVEIVKNNCPPEKKVSTERVCVPFNPFVLSPESVGKSSESDVEMKHLGMDGTYDSNEPIKINTPVKSAPKPKRGKNTARKSMPTPRRDAVMVDPDFEVYEVSPASEDASEGFVTVEERISPSVVNLGVRKQETPSPVVLSSDDSMPHLEAEPSIVCNIPAASAVKSEVDAEDGSNDAKPVCLINTKAFSHTNMAALHSGTETVSVKQETPNVMKKIGRPLGSKDKGKRMDKAVKGKGKGKGKGRGRGKNLDRSFYEPSDDEDTFKSLRLKMTLDIMKKGQKRKVKKEGAGTVSRLGKRGPFVRVHGAKETPVSCEVVNVKDDELDRVSDKKKSHRGDLPGGSHPTSFKLLESVPWKCVFCGRESNYSILGDLFGPYYGENSTPGSPRKLDSRDSMEKIRKRKSSDGPEVVDLTQSSRKKEMKKRASLGEGTSGGSTRSDDLPPEVWIHEDCVIWSSGIFIVGTKLQGLEEAVAVAKQTICSACKEVGATLGCLHKGCNLSYHYLCAVEKECLLDEENFSLVCPKHKDKKVKMLNSSSTSIS